MLAQEKSVDVVMTLHEGSERGPLVPCHYSSPKDPPNQELVPAAAFCLLPKSALKSGTKYTVVAEIVGEGQRKVWSFRT